MQVIRGIKRLVALDTDPFLTISLYLNVDGRQYPNREYEIELKELIRRAQQQLMHYPEDIREAARRDLERIDRYVRREFVRDNTRLLVIFACEPADLFETLTYAIPMKSQIILYPKGPYVTPLLIALAGHADALVIMVSREVARGFYYLAGHLEEIGNVREDVPARVNYGGFKGYEERRIDRHVEEHVQWYLKHVAEQAYRWFVLYDPELVLLMGHPEVTGSLTRYLPYPMTQRLGPVMDYFIESGGLREIRERVETAVMTVERQRVREWIEQLRRQVPHRAVIGIEATLQALNAWRCAVLVFDPDEMFEGYTCPQCGYLALRRGTCPRCRSDLQYTENLLNEAIESAVHQGAELVPIRHDAELVRLIDTMGAVLRF